MSPSPALITPEGNRGISLLAVGFGLTGLACGVLAWMATWMAFGTWAAEKIERSQGELSFAVIDWLKHHSFATSFTLAGLSCFAPAFVSWRLQSHFARWLNRVRLPPRPWVFPAVATALIFLLYAPTLVWGYFRYDDFELLTVAQEGNFWSVLWQPHGDHVMPLARMLAWLGLHLIGTSAWPYNLWVLLCFTSTVIAGLLLLDELDASRGARSLFIVLALGWSPWAEILSGYYILSTYLVIAACGLLSAVGTLRWNRTGQRRWAWLVFISVLVAPLVDVSGLYVPAIVGVFLLRELLCEIPAAEKGRRRFRRRYLLTGFVVSTAIGGILLLYAYHVRNPGAFLSMAGATPRSWSRLALDLLYLIDVGLLTSLVTPFVYARLPISVLLLVAALVGATFVLFSALMLRRASRQQRLTLVSVFLIVAGTSLMTVLGRYDPETIIVRWAAKHVAPAYLWLALLLVLSWDAGWRRLAPGLRRIPAELTAIFVGLFLAAQTIFGLVGLAVEFPPFGYPAEIRDARRRATEVTGLRDGFVRELTTRLPPGATVPVLDGNALIAACPSLFRYNLSHYLPFYAREAGSLTFVRNDAMQAWRGTSVRTVASLRTAVTPEFLDVLRSVPEVRERYLIPLPLDGGPLPATETTPAQSLEPIEALDTIEVRDSTWDPETLSRLRITSDTAGAQFTVVFRHSLLEKDWTGAIALPPQHVTIGVDLRQVIAFALSKHVSHLRVIPNQAGRYRFELVGPDE